MGRYTLADLDAARKAAARADDAVGERANNPERGRTRAMAARALVREIESALREDGTLPLSDIERLHAQLDAAFPNAKSREVVELNGVRYQRVFWPLEKSRSGKTVLSWGRSWEIVA